MYAMGLWRHIGSPRQPVPSVDSEAALPVLTGSSTAVCRLRSFYPRRETELPRHRWQQSAAGRQIDEAEDQHRCATPMTFAAIRRGAQAINRLSMKNPGVTERAGDAGEGDDGDRPTRNRRCPRAALHLQKHADRILPFRGLPQKCDRVAAHVIAKRSAWCGATCPFSISSSR